MARYDRDDDAGGQIVGFVLLLLSLLIFGLFLLSQGLTRLLLRYVLNPILDGLLDRHDGAVILCSAVLWGLVVGGILFPLGIAQGWYGDQSHNMLQAWFWTCVMGLLWGVSVGAWVLGIWWEEAASQAPAGHDVVQLLDRPIEIRQAASPAFESSSSSGISAGRDDAWLEELITGTRSWSKDQRLIKSN